ncbi:hypothetical protein D3C87_1759400 [compost metagenome]
MGEGHGGHEGVGVLSGVGQAIIVIGTCRHVDRQGKRDVIDFVEVISRSDRRHQHVGELSAGIFRAQGPASGASDVGGNVGVLHRHADRRRVVPATFAGVPDVGEVGHGVGNLHVQPGTQGTHDRHL